ncbi:lipid transfer [Diplodia corticola]|uniref:Lipid transfer n=1 Tax=Diplodia corticola TaxID=236234 RepID=A0A1J9S5Q9_9PEZI|nr:lipid transfer [Diplodia corticola]OJD35847.1 lipid transfer [Diplodia corticola]
MSLKSGYGGGRDDDATEGTRHKAPSREYRAHTIGTRTADKIPSSAAFDAIAASLADDADRKDAVKKGGAVFAFTIKNQAGETDSWYIDLKKTGTVGKGAAPEGGKADGEFDTVDLCKDSDDRLRVDGMAGERPRGVLCCQHNASIAVASSLSTIARAMMALASASAPAPAPAPAPARQLAVGRRLNRGIIPTPRCALSAHGVEKWRWFTMLLSDSDFASLVAGKANAQKLFMSGKLKIKGDVMKATKIEPVLKKVQAKAKLKQALKTTSQLESIPNGDQFNYEMSTLVVLIFSDVLSTLLSCSAFSLDAMILDSPTTHDYLDDPSQACWLYAEYKVNKHSMTAFVLINTNSRHEPEPQPQPQQLFPGDGHPPQSEDNIFATMRDLLEADLFGQPATAQP